MNNNSINYKIGFGKFKDRTFKEVLDIEPSYINWCLINVKFFFFDDDFLDDLKAYKKDFVISELANKKRIEKEDAFKAEFFRDSRMDDLEDELSDILNDEAKEYWESDEGMDTYWNID